MIQKHFYKIRLCTVCLFLVVKINGVEKAVVLLLKAHLFNNTLAKIRLTVKYYLIAQLPKYGLIHMNVYGEI